MLHSIEAVIGSGHDHGERLTFRPTERRLAEHDRAIVGYVRIEPVRVERLNGQNVSQPGLSLRLYRFDPGSIRMVRHHVISLPDSWRQSARTTHPSQGSRAVDRNIDTSAAVDRGRRRFTFHGMLRNVIVRVGVLVLMSLTAVQTACAQSHDETRLRGSDYWETDFSVASVPLSEIVSGGPPKDGIPAIDRPRFETVAAAGSWLGKRDPILVVDIDGTTKGYPLGILIWHEIVNDELAGVPLIVTFCPLCNTALVFDGRLGERVLNFGTTGRLRQSDMVMYDRQTESWWQQAVGEAIVGTLTGERLTMIPAVTLGWDRARQLYPDMRVLSRDTGFPSYMSSGRYGQNPYENYDSRRGPYQRFFQGSFSDDLPAMERVVAINEGSGWAASFSDLKKAGTAHGKLEGREFVVFWAPGTASALDKSRIASGRDIGQTAAFSRIVDGRTLTFEKTGDHLYTDHETGTTWDLAGRATEGPLAGARLTPVPHGNHFWFAWTAFRPQSAMWSAQ